MSKQLVDIGVYQYPLTEEGIQEATDDADEAASREKYYVVKNSQGYYGPLNEAQRKYGFSSAEIVYTSDPDKQAHEYRANCMCIDCVDRRSGGILEYHDALLAEEGE